MTDLLTGTQQHLSAGTIQAGSGPTGAPEQQLYIVFLDGPGQGDARGLQRRLSSEFGVTQPQDLLEHLNGFTAMLTTAQAQRLKQNRNVRSIEADSVVSLVEPINRSEAMAPSGSGTVSATGQLTPYGISKVWGTITINNSVNNVKYAFVLDTGISKNTNDLNVSTTYSRNFTSTKTSDWIDYHGHGTHVAGTIAAINDGDGVVGVAPGATVISIRVLDRRGSGLTSWIVQGINYAAGLVKTGGLKNNLINDLVANMSLGGGLNSSIDSAIRAAAANDSGGRFLRFAVAAGNSSADVDGFSPANTGDHANIYTVSAIDINNNMASFSNYDDVNDIGTNDDVDYSAPGVGVQSLGMSGGIVTMSGTSMASPHMAGVLLMGGPINTTSHSNPVLAGAAGDFLALLS